jgi:hypothetical protein
MHKSYFTFKYVTTKIIVNPYLCRRILGVSKFWCAIIHYGNYITLRYCTFQEGRRNIESFHYRKCKSKLYQYFISSQSVWQSSRKIMLVRMGGRESSYTIGGNVS